MKQEELKQMLDYVGGKENIVSLTHCVTRLRFVLKNRESVNEEGLKNLSLTKGIAQKGGQFQVIIGPAVERVFNEFLSVNDLNFSEEEIKNSKVNPDDNLFQRALAFLSSIFIPLLPAIIAGGLMLGFRNIIGDIEFGGSTVAERSVFWNGVYEFLWLPSQAIFHFLPVGITWSVTKKMGTSQILGIVLGLTMISPLLLPPVQAGINPDNILYWDFGFFQISRVGYQSQVVPAVIAALFMSHLELRLKKHIPDVVQMIFVPFLTILLAVFLTHLIIGPFGRMIGDGIGDLVGNALVGSWSIPFSFVFGFLYAPIVITGLHHVFPAVNLMLIEQLGGTPLFPLVALSNIAQASAALGIVYVIKSNKERQISVPATVSGYLGVTEPAMFGVNIPYKYAFISALIGSALAATIASIFGVMANSIGVGGIPAILSIKPQYWAAFSFAMVVAIIVPFVLTVILGKRIQKNRKI